MKTNLEEIKQRVDIVDVISTYVRLQKVGNQFRTNCPFHNEKSPSFYVSPHKGFYHCFGCGVHGDIFGFTMQIEGIPFKDALRMMAERAGISLSQVSHEDSSRTLDIMEDACVFYQRHLQESFMARGYVDGRGIESETVHLFRIGFAPAAWRDTYSFLQKKGYSDEEILESGLCIKHEKGLYDRFRSRVMFPIMNPSGKVVAFSGRIIGEEAGKDGVAKYVNSPETPLYHKSNILYGYDKAKKEIAKSKRVVLVEGQMDTVMSHQAGVLDTVAISGTALTEEQVKIMKRFAETLVLSLDTDKAGFEAMKKSAQVALFHEMNVEALYIEDAKDPAEIIAESKEEWRRVVDKPVSVFTFLTKKIKEQHAAEDTIKILQRIKKEVFPVLASVQSPMLREGYGELIARELGISTETILSEMKTVQFQESAVEESQFLKTHETKPEQVFIKSDPLLLVLQVYVLLDMALWIDKHKYLAFLKEKLDLVKDVIELEMLDNQELKEVESIKLEKEFAESEVDKLEILKEKIYFALKQIYEKSKQKINNKIRESYSDDLLIKLKDLNSALDTLSKEVSEL
jgi:DNA primase